jgi:hypothetical protein
MEEAARLMPVTALSSDSRLAVELVVRDSVVASDGIDEARSITPRDEAILRR